MTTHELKFWALDPNCENLCNTTIEQVVIDWLDDNGYEPGKRLTVYGFVPVKPTSQEFQFVDDLLENLDEEYGSPEGEHEPLSTEDLTHLRTLEDLVVDHLLARYEPWVCALVETREICVDDYTEGDQ